MDEKIESEIMEVHSIMFLRGFKASLSNLLKLWELNWGYYFGTIIVCLRGHDVHNYVDHIIVVG